MANRALWHRLKRKPKTQTTKVGLEIPVPNRKDVFAVFEKAAKGSGESGPKK